LADALTVEGNVNAAYAQFEEAIRDEPSDAANHLEFAQVLEAEGDLNRAIEQYRAAQQLRPDDAAINHHLQQLLAKVATPGK
jgi:Tfp pilus assembly protein PilF